MAVSISPTLSELLLIMKEKSAMDLHVSMPGIVQAYDAEKQTADVQPAVKQRYETLSGETQIIHFPQLPDVPVCWPRAGGFYLHAPLKPGDGVLLVFFDLAAGGYLATGAESAPDSVRRHDLSDVVAFPGLYPATRPLKAMPAAAMALGKEQGRQILIDESGSLKVTMGNGTSLLIEGQDGGTHMTVGGSVPPPVSVAIAETLALFWATVKTAFDNHTHLITGTTASPGTAIAATNANPANGLPSWNAAIASDKMKIPPNSV